MKRIAAILLVAVLMLSVIALPVGASFSGTENGAQKTEQTADGNTAPQQNKTLSTIFTIVPILIIVAFFYFGMYKPQKKQEKEKKALMDSLEVGNEIMTIGGIMGRIVSVKEDSVIIESGSDKNKLQISKQAISSVNNK